MKWQEKNDKNLYCFLSTTSKVKEKEIRHEYSLHGWTPILNGRRKDVFSFFLYVYIYIYLWIVQSNKQTFQTGKQNLTRILEEKKQLRTSTLTKNCNQNSNNQINVYSDQIFWISIISAS